MERSFSKFLTGMKPSGTSPSDAETIASNLKAFQPKSQNTFVTIPGQTNYCIASIPALPYTHPDAPAVFLLAQALSAGYLHREIREKGGAYGGGASSDPVGGLFTFYSYRDPNTMETLETFDKSIEWAKTPGNITQKELEEAQLRAFKQLDAPLAPSARGNSGFLSGISEDERQRFRDGLLAASPADLARAADKHFAAPRAYAIVGSAEKAPQSADWVVLDAEGNAIAR